MFIFKYIIAGLFAASISLFLGVAGLTFYPIVLVEGEPPPTDFRYRQYSMEELDAATARREAEIKERGEKFQRNELGEPTLVALSETRKSFLWLTWIPWLALPFVVHDKMIKRYAIVPLPAAVLVLFGVFSFLEFIFYMLTLSAGVYLSTKYVKRKP